MATPEEKQIIIKEAQSAVREYLSGLTGARAQKNLAVQAVLSMREREVRIQRANEYEERADAALSSYLEKIRKNPAPEIKEAFKIIIEALGKRQDLSFIGRKVVEHCRRELDKRQGP